MDSPGDGTVETQTEVIPPSIVDLLLAQTELKITSRSNGTCPGHVTGEHLTLQPLDTVEVGHEVALPEGPPGEDSLLGPGDGGGADIHGLPLVRLWMSKGQLSSCMRMRNQPTVLV